MLITAIESLVISLPFDMGGPHPLFAGQPGIISI
jgi:D-galactarolactone cycloisomerase